MEKNIQELLEIEKKILELNFKKSKLKHLISLEQAKEFKKLKMNITKDRLKLRAEELKKLKKSGKSVNEISNLLGLTRQRVYQILGELK